MRRHLALILFFSLSSTSFATITIATTGTNASNAVASTVTAGGPTFYYSNPSGISDGLSPPNWAAANPAVPCTPASFQVNPNCRDPTSLFYFQATDSVATTGNATLYIRYVTSGSTAPVAGAAPGTLISTIGTAVFQMPYTANNVATATTLHFGDICNALSSDATLGISSTCVATNPTTPVQAQLYIIADANGDGYYGPGEDLLTFTFTVQSSIPINSSITDQIGLYSFQTFPGDGEVDINQPLPGGIGLSQAYAVNFYYVTGPDVYTAFSSTTFQTINADNVEPATTIPYFQILLDGNGNLTGNAAITGLSNGTSYYFRSSIVDGAGNIGYIESAASGDDTPANPPLPFEWHAAKPDQIAGLLKKNGQCFIATAAYGTPMAKQVQILREFRDKILMKTSSGKKFVYWYYKNGNALADKIRDRDDIRAVVRTVLYPVIGYGWLALKIGAFNAALLISTLLMLPLLLIQLRRSRKILEDIT